MNVVIEFLTANPNSNKGQIADGVNLRGLGLFNLLKAMVKDGQLTVEGEGHDSTYRVASVDAVTKEHTSEEMVIENPNSDEARSAESNKATNEANEETAGEQKAQATEQPAEVETKPTKKQTSRNTGSFSFMGTSYNKGKLIHAVVAAHVAKNKNITHDKLKEVFPDTLLKRFGIFQTVEKAREISGAKYDRYFFKDDLQIRLKDCVVVTCNQITSENILPFLTVAREKLGYGIDAE